MYQNYHIAKSLSDASFYAFKQRMKYKGEKYGKNVIEIGGFDTWSRQCSLCGNIKHDLRLPDGVYHWEVCDLTIDRYYNASKNIKKMGLIKLRLVQSAYKSANTATSGLCGIYLYRQMSVDESGSSKALAEVKLNGIDECKKCE